MIILIRLSERITKVYMISWSNITGPLASNEIFYGRIIENNLFLLDASSDYLANLGSAPYF